LHQQNIENLSKLNYH